MEPLTLDEAIRMLVAARTKSTEIGLKVSIAVLDPRGDLVALHRLDGALWRTVPIAQDKAAASAAWDKPSGELKDRWHQPVGRALSMMEHGRLIPWPGALPPGRVAPGPVRCRQGHPAITSDLGQRASHMRLEDLQPQATLRGILPDGLVTVVSVQLETNLVIARLDKLARNEEVQQKLMAPDGRWDLVVCDEAHKMSATFFGGEIKYTKRYRLGQLLSTLTRHFLLLTATPHNGKEEDFQLFLALLDGDRFEGRFRDGVHTAEVSDLMRRMVKEGLLTFEGTPLFPERIARTVPYRLSDAEAQLYRAVTDYVRQEFNRAEALENDKRAGTVGFALTILQRRLASSPEAIYQSLRRRRERLESRLRELELLQRGVEVGPVLAAAAPMLDAEDVEDLEEAPDHEVEAAEAEILDQATAARTIAELRAEIEALRRLEGLALGVRRGGEDRKWRELASLLGEIFTPAALAGRVAEPPAPYGADPIPPAGPLAAPEARALHRASRHPPVPRAADHDRPRA